MPDSRLPVHRVVSTPFPKAQDLRALLPVAAAAPFPEGVRSVLDMGDARVDGTPARWLDSDGEENAGIISYVRDGENRILKITQHKVGWAGPEDGFFSHADPTLTAERQYRGYLLGELFGGPKVLRAGIIERGANPPAYFIEMRELFPGQSARSLKSIGAEGGRDLARLLVERPGGATAADLLGPRLMAVMQSGVLPDDPDVFVAPDGKFAWIDTARWRRAAPDEISLFARPAWLLLLAVGQNPEAGRRYLLGFLKALKASSLPDVSKNILLEALGRQDRFDKLLGELGLTRPDEQGRPLDTLLRLYGAAG